MSFSIEKKIKKINESWSTPKTTIYIMYVIFHVSFMSHLSLTHSPGPFNSIKSTVSFIQINNFNLEIKD